MSLFQSNLRKQIRNLPKILNFVKIIQYYSKLFTGVLSQMQAAVIVGQGCKMRNVERVQHRLHVPSRLPSAAGSTAFDTVTSKERIEILNIES